MTSQDIISENPRWSRRRWLVVGLVGSIALNLFLAGLVGAWLLRPAFIGSRASPAGVSSLTADHIADRIARRLPEPDKPIIRQAFKQHEQEIALSLKAWREAQQMSRRSLRAEPFDPAAFTAAFTRSQEARLTYQMAVHQAVREASLAMTREGRLKLTMSPSTGRR